MTLAATLSWAGAAAALWRLGRAPDPDAPPPAALPRVSIVIPARNEARTLPGLLTSLRALDYPSYEVIVVDDNSTDGTAGIAASHGVRVLSAGPLPDGWMGKNWACHQAAREATGELILFTDADTVHRPDGLRRAVAFLMHRRADLASALPYHRCPTLWEKLMGPFHALLLIATAHRSPRPGRLYAIGQFLLFRRAFYDRLGGHETVAARYPDDLALAEATLAAGGAFALHAGRPLFDVRMYGSFSEFLAGWRRNFAAGLRLGHWTGAAEVTLVIVALAGCGTWIPALLIVVLIAARQRRWGDFSVAGAILYPVALAVYVAVTAAALSDLARGGRLRWKDRTLTGWAGGRSA